MSHILLFNCCIVGLFVVFALIGCEAEHENQGGTASANLIQEMPVRIIVDRRGMCGPESEPERRTIDDLATVTKIVNEVNGAKLNERGTDAIYIGLMEIQFDGGRKPVRIDYFSSRLIRLGDKYYNVPRGGWFDREAQEALRELEESENSETETTE